MSTFIHSIFDFFKQIFESIYYELILSSLSRDFLDNKILEGTLINLNLTWSQLIMFLLPTIVVFLFIYLVYHIVYKVIGLICLR